jgi:hypothetical protein
VTGTMKTQGIPGYEIRVTECAYASFDLSELHPYWEAELVFRDEDGTVTPTGHKAQRWIHHDPKQRLVKKALARELKWHRHFWECYRKRRELIKAERKKARAAATA